MPTEPEVLDNPTAPPPARDHNVLPEGITLQTDYKADIDKYFDKEPESEPKETKAVAPKEEPKEVDPKVAPKGTSLAEQLAARAAPKTEEPKKEPKALAVADPIAEVEAQMQKANPKWKPAQGWETLKTIAKTEAQKRAELEAKLAEAETKLKTSPVLPGMTAEEVERLKNEHKEASDRLMLVDLQNHPTYKAQFIEPRDAEIARAKELLDAHGVKGSVQELLGKSRSELGKAVEELTKDLPSFDRTEVADAIRKAYSLEQNGKAALGSSKEILKGIQQNTQARQKAAFEKRYLPVSQAIGKHLIKLEVPANATAEERAEVEAYIEGGKKIREVAERYAFSVSDDETAAEVAMKAAAYDFHIGTVQPRISKEISAIMEDNRRLAQELTALRNRNPNLRISHLPASDSGGTKRMEDMGHEEAAAALAAKR